MVPCSGRYTVMLSLICLLFVKTAAQRIYNTHSVLATGNWYKIGVKADGVYKIDASFYPQPF